MKPRRVAAFVLFVACVLAAPACGPFRTTPIGDIVQNPAAFEGKTVRVAGTVVEATNLLVVKFYQVEDATGRMAVVARDAVPRRGAQVTVRGRVHQAFVLGDQSLTVIVEER